MGKLEEALIDEMKVVFKSLIKMGIAKEDVEDITQSTLYKALRYVDSIDGRTARAWLFRVALNEFYNICRKNTCININDIDILDLLAESAEDAVINSEKVKDIKDTLDKLQPVYRDLLILKYIIGFSYRNISEFTGYSGDKVKIYLYRARNKFKELWGE